jgi:hypothetical protein
MLKSMALALSILVVTPLAVQASEITLLPAVKLQIGDQDRHGNYWDGGHWRDRSWWGNHYEWRENRWQPHGHHDDHRDRDRHDNGHHDRDRHHH